MTDNAPLFPEFGHLATTCNGDMTGCAVCTAGSILRRYGKPIPLGTTADGETVLNARELGRSMGARHRAAAAAGTSGNRHGLSLSGACSPPQSGTNWCAFCIYLELKARGLPVTYAKLTDAQLASHLKADHSIATPGWYGEIPVVSKDSYDSKTPARGRSDTGFVGWHMVAAHGAILNADGSIAYVIVSDADFGSASRPRVPPHSLWRWRDYLDYYHRTGGWGVTVVTAKPAPPPPPAGTWWPDYAGPPKATDTFAVQFRPGKYPRYHSDGTPAGTFPTASGFTAYGNSRKKVGARLIGKLTSDIPGIWVDVHSGANYWSK